MLSIHKQIWIISEKVAINLRIQGVKDSGIQVKCSGITGTDKENTKRPARGEKDAQGAY